MTLHLKGREKALEVVRLDGEAGRVDRTRLPAQRRVHARAVHAVHGRAPGTGPARRPLADRRARRERGDGARHRGHRPRLPDLLAARLPGARGRAHPPPARRLDRGPHAPPALARLRDRARGPALASDGAGEGRRVRRARDRARAPARARVPRRRPGDPAPFPREAARGARLRPRPVRLCRARPRHRHRAPLVGPGAPRALARASEPGPVRRDRGRRPDGARIGTGPPRDERHGPRLRLPTATPTPRSARNSPASSGRSCRARSTSSRSSGASRPH